MEIEHTN